MKMHLNFLILFLFAFLSPVFADPTPTELFNKKLFLTRAVLSRPTAKKFISEILWEDLKITDAPTFKLPRGKFITETQMLVLLDNNPGYIDEVEAYVKQVSSKDATLDSAAMAAKREKWKEKFREILSDPVVLKKFRSVNNPLEPYLVSDDVGYSDVKTFVNHQRTVDGQMVAADDLKQVWIDEIRKAKKEIAINVFDFDLEDVADELIAAAKRGVEVKVGIDAGVIEHRPEVAAVFKKLNANGVFAHAVDSVGLNHQKMMAIDWTVPKDARVVFSSGNLTQSCLGPEGDLKHIPVDKRPKMSVPNANHVITMKSDAMSSIVAHEISKTVDKGFQLKGRQYPMGGAFKVWGGPKNLGADRPFITLAFTPNGAMDDVNTNFISQAVLRTRGPVKMAQFAFSSEPVNQALFKRAQMELAEGGQFVFKSVGDTPFAMQEWSQFLKMSGLELIRNEDKTIPPKYIELTENEWEKMLGKKAYKELKEGIKVAPKIYGNHNLKGGEKITSKIHHKLLITGTDGKQVVITGSFNFSAGAETNQEYVLMIRDQRINKELSAAVDQLHADGKHSVFREAITRNVRRNFDDAIALDHIEMKGSSLKRIPTSTKCLPLAEALRVLK